jgi:hypothetical protein
MQKRGKGENIYKSLKYVGMPPGENFFWGGGYNFRLVFHTNFLDLSFDEDFLLICYIFNDLKTIFGSVSWVVFVVFTAEKVESNRGIMSFHFIYVVGNAIFCVKKAGEMTKMLLLVVQ